MMMMVVLMMMMMMMMMIPSLVHSEKATADGIAGSFKDAFMTL